MWSRLIQTIDRKWRFEKRSGTSEKQRKSTRCWVSSLMFLCHTIMTSCLRALINVYRSFARTLTSEYLKVPTNLYCCTTLKRDTVNLKWSVEQLPNHLKHTLIKRRGFPALIMQLFALWEQRRPLIWIITDVYISTAVTLLTMVSRTRLWKSCSLTDTSSVSILRNHYSVLRLRSAGGEDVLKNK